MKFPKSLAGTMRVLHADGSIATKIQPEHWSPGFIQATIDARSEMRRFVLFRGEDVSGCSGLGVVAEGVVFTDSTVALRWLTSLKSTALYDSIDDVVAIHGHGGATEVRWIHGR
jgi:hypothetical protein